MTISQIAKRASSLVIRNSPAILTGLGAAGVVTTAYLAFKAYPAAERLLIEEANRQSTDDFEVDPLDFDFKKRVQVTWTAFIPAFTLGGLSVACIIGANSIASRRNAALVSLYTLSESAFREYREKVVEQVSSTQEDKIRTAVAQDGVRRDPKDVEVIITGNGDQKMKDSLTGRYFMSTIEKIRKAENDINRTCINEMSASMNEFYNLIGLRSVEIGEQVGWTLDQPIEVQFDAVLDEANEAVIVLNYRRGPVSNFNRVW